MYVCANDEGDYLRRGGFVERSNENGEKHPATALRAVAVFHTQLGARMRCREIHDEAAERLVAYCDLQAVPLADFGQRTNVQWQAMLERRVTGRLAVYSDPDAV
jgi:hypothetical protein